MKAVPLLTRLLGMAMALSLGLTAALAQGLQITDDRGAVVQLRASPQRIVSLLPSLTETVCALGQCQRLVGVDRYSNWPASVRALPQLGGLDDTPIEAIVALKPDVVLLAKSARITARLESLGLKVIALEPESFSDVQGVILRVGSLLAVPDAQQLWTRSQSAISTAAASVPGRAQGIRVYFEVSQEPYAAGPASFIGELLARLGARNIVPAGLGSFPLINPEFVVRADPDLIMVGDGYAANLQRRPGWEGLRALRKGRVCAFKPEQADVLVRPGPRIAEAAELIARCLREKAA